MSALIRDLIVNAGAGGVEIALLEDKHLVELHQEKNNNTLSVGDIFLGKVKKTVPGLNAAFIDIGDDKDAFLHYTDLGPQLKTLCSFVNQTLNDKGNGTPTIENYPKEEDIVKTGKITDVLNKKDILLVQVLKEPISSKGPRLSCEITLAGKFIVMAPFGGVTAVSRKIKQSEERNRLQRLVESLKPENFGVIVRTAAEGKKIEEIHDDIRNLVEKWERIVEEIKVSTIPAKVMSEVSKPSSLLRDLLDESFSKIVVNDKGLTADIKSVVADFLPGKEKIVSSYEGKAPIFDHFKVTKQIKSSFGKTVSMASGAYLVIEHTEAMHVVDVNSGYKTTKGTNQELQALTVNLEAAGAIARQLRLRDLGGLVVIDFIDMKDPENKKTLHRRMREEMTADRSRHTILALSKFNLMQITRERSRPEVKISTAEICPSCRGTGKVRATVLIIDEIENNLGYLLKEMDYKELKIVVHPFVEAFIKKGIISKQWKWFWNFKKWVMVEGNDNYALTEYHFFQAENDEIKL